MPSGPGSGHYLSTDTSVPFLAHVVDGSNDPSTGDTVLLTIYSLALGQFLDFDDMTFKASSHTDIDQAMTQVSATNAPGAYLYELDYTSITNASANDTLYGFVLVTTGKNAPPIEIRIDGWVGIQQRMHDAYVFDGGAGASQPTVDSKGVLLAGRFRVFASPAAATAATAGAVDGADGEILLVDLTGTAASAGLPATLKKIGG